ncbi:MAG: type II toxin-antitoxin system HicA family toxin [Acidobacteria bacterium]|nr:type II toxin-antitoxin system HicA family toxin [Acidobacteriota bacterium]
MGDRGTPRLTADQVISILRRHGFALAGSAGSHQKWRNVSTAKQVIVPYHRGRH